MIIEEYLIYSIHIKALSKTVFYFVHNPMDLFISNSSDYDFSFGILVMMKNI